MDALHRCDNPPCCNGAHIRWGRPAENVNDTMTRGRHRPVRGERNKRATITAAQAREIKERIARRERQIDIASTLKVSRSLVADISAGRAWKEP
jgi:hypothetical protein